MLDSSEPKLWGNDVRENSLPNCPTFSPTTPTGLLTKKTLTGLSRYFQDRGHHPSPAMWSALADLTSTLEAMARGEASQRFYLSSLDPGVGKTQTVVHFVDSLLGLPAYSHVGVLICVARLSEIPNLVHSIGIPSDMLAVITSDITMNSLGVATADEAQVLITTQQMIEKRLNSGKFADASMFHYRGQPRAVRIWDESYLPGQTITLNRDDVAFLFKPLRLSFPGLTEQIESLFTTLRDVEDGTIMVLPDFAGGSGVDLNDVLALFDDHRDNDERKLKDDQRMALSSLWFLSGKTVTIRRDGNQGNTVIDYRDTLPDDLAPMVILDASGRVRETYRDIEESRGTLVRLKSAVKRYDRLTVNLWRVGGGKRSFQSNRDRLIAGIAKTIETKPDERWLVVSHRKDARVGDVEAGVSQLLDKTPRENVSFITWGSHMATNEYVEVRNVILAGTLFYRPSFYEALKRLAAGRPATRGSVTKDELEKTIAGEHAHAILQALCRGSVRRCDGEFCHPCDAYIIASVRSGIPDAMPRIFPGCSVVSWKPVERSLTGHVKKAVEIVETWATSASAGAVLPFKAVSKALGITSHVFRDRVRFHPDFSEALAELGVIQWGKGRYFTGFAKAGAEEF